MTPLSRIPIGTVQYLGCHRLTPVDMLQLPTGPKQRSPDEYAGGSRLGGGFSNYDDDRRGPRRRGFEDDRSGPRRGSDFDAPPPPPSRADKVDNWAAGKQAAPPPDTGRRSSRNGSTQVGFLGLTKSTIGLLGNGPPLLLIRVGAPLGMGRPRLVLDPPSRGIANEGGPTVMKTEKENPYGVAKPREEVLAEKGRMKASSRLPALKGVQGRRESRR